MQLRTFSVSELNKYINRLISIDPIMNAIKVEGEIGNFKLHSSGHAYFSIKDKDSRINCVIFSSYFQRLNFLPKDGDFVEIFGRVSVYEKNGTYQLYVNKMKTAGIGALYKQFDELKTKLAKEGLFDENTKKLIPKYPSKVIIITSPTGAAIRDVISVIKRRNPFIELLIIPVSVQGNKTVEEITNAFDIIKGVENADAIILTRGGGSYDELFNFNNEFIARKINECEIPVISAIGHEVDFTIADFVSDLRAPTPSSAAELVTIDVYEQIRHSKVLVDKMHSKIVQKISVHEQILNNYSYVKMKFGIEKQILNFTHEFEVLKQQALQQINDKILNIQHQFDLEIQKIDTNNPLNILNKGYSKLTNKEDKSISSITELNKGEKITNQLKNGKIISIIDYLEVNSEG